MSGRGRGRGSSGKGRGAGVCEESVPPLCPSPVTVGRGRRRREESEQQPGRDRREKEPERCGGKEAAQKKRSSQRPSSEASDPRPARSLREVLRKTLALRQEAVSKASERVNRVRDHLVAAIRKDRRFASLQVAGTGSYYERLKISKPDEFDIMLTLPRLRLELQPCESGASAGAFCSVRLKRRSGEGTVDGFLDDNGFVSAVKMRTALRSIIVREVKKIEEENVQVEKQKPGCPAVTLLIGEPPSVISVDIILALEGCRHNQCSSTKGGLNIEKWLGTKVKKDFLNAPLCLVPKNVKDGKCFIDSWRLSFSHIEKDIIMHHGSEKTCCEAEGKKCCRKACLKLLKYLLELLKTKHEKSV